MDDLGTDYVGPEAHQVRLFNEWKPALDHGIYSISATQRVSVAGRGESVTLQNVHTDSGQPRAQRFEVRASPFALDPDCVSSFYPPANQTEDSKTLPHIVFNDPHLPWSRKVALIAFERGDLFSDMIGTPSLHFNGVENQQSDGSFQMTVAEYTTIGSIYDANTLRDAHENAPMRVVFPKRQKIIDLLGDVGGLGLLNHVRMANTAAMPDKSKSYSTYSVVISPNFGFLGTTTPRDMIVHLLTLDGLDNTSLTNSAQERVGLNSLFSWAYKCDNESRNIYALEGLVRDSQRYQQQIDSALPSKSTEKVYEALRQRISAGYALCPWRLSTGERFTSLLRGPLAIQPISSGPVGKNGVTNGRSGSRWPDSSKTGEDYQLLDSEVLIPDMTYCAAWHLGRTQAIADQDFTAAMHRVRALVAQKSAALVRVRANGIPQPTNVVSMLPALLSRVRDLSLLNTGLPNRISSLSDAPVTTDLGSTVLRPVYEATVAETFSTLFANSTEPTSTPTTADLAVTDQTKATNNVDLQIIFGFLIDRLRLYEIPVHYQLPNPNLCPLESLRFFNIDDAYLDCLIDGALSIANHSAAEYDISRRAIKRLFNEHLETGQIRIPKMLVMFNSFLIKSIPDLKIAIRCKKIVDGKLTADQDVERDPVIEYTQSDDNTLRILLDCTSHELDKFSVSLPAHRLHYTLPIDAENPTKLAFRKFDHRTDEQGKAKLTPRKGAALTANDHISVDLATTITTDKRNIGLAALRKIIDAIASPAQTDAATLAYQLTAHDVRVDLDFPGTVGYQTSANRTRKIYIREDVDVSPIVRDISNDDHDDAPAAPTTSPVRPSPVPSSTQLPSPLNPASIAVLSSPRAYELPATLELLPPSERERMEPSFSMSINPRWINRVELDTGTAPKQTAYTFEPVFQIFRLKGGPPTPSLSSSSRLLHSLDVYIPSGNTQTRAYPGAIPSGSTTASHAFLPLSKIYRQDASMLRNQRLIPRISGNSTWTRVRLLWRGGLDDFDTEKEGETLVNQVSPPSPSLPSTSFSLGLGLDLTDTRTTNMEASFKLGRRTISDLSSSSAIAGPVDSRTKRCMITLVERYWQPALATAPTTPGTQRQGRFAYAFSTVEVDRSPDVKLDDTSYA